jgi:hypothetical protein
LVEDTEVTGENNGPVAIHWQTLSHNVVLSTPRHERGFELTTLVVIGIDCTGSCKSYYHTIMTTMAPTITYIKGASVKTNPRKIKSEK